MKKLFILTALAGLFAINSVNAQTTPKKDPAMGGSKLGVGADFAFPVGDAANVLDFGYGGSLNLQIPVASKLNFTGSAGYLSFQTKKDLLGNTTSFGTIPVKAGLRYFLAENFYAGGELGAAFSTEKNGKTSFAYAPGLGFEFPVDDKLAVDIGARYEGWSANGATTSFIGLRAALNFGL